MKKPEHNSNILVLFDIDGTLLYSTSHKLRERFTYAVEEVHGKRKDLNWDTIEGSTDNDILLGIMNDLHIDEEHFKNSLLDVHEKAFEHFSLHVSESYAESILPGARDILNKLQGTVHIGILTGNYSKTAWKKLELVGLKEYFDFGLYGHEADDRNQLALTVFKKAKEAFGKKFLPQHIVIIGDTPKDIECARFIKCHVIAVGSGKYSTEELKTYNPDLLVSSLEDQRIEAYIHNLNKKTKQ